MVNSLNSFFSFPVAWSVIAFNSIIIFLILRWRSITIMYITVCGTESIRIPDDNGEKSNFSARGQKPRGKTVYRNRFMMWLVVFSVYPVITGGR